MSELFFYLTSGLAVLATVIALTRTNAAHALIYLILSLLAVAVLFDSPRITSLVWRRRFWIDAAISVPLLLRLIA